MLTPLRLNLISIGFCILLATLCFFVTTSAASKDLTAVNPLSSKALRRRSRDLSLLSGIYPGTKWCGKGNISQSPTDLGKLKQVDNCCRKHDNCPMFVNPGDTKYGITNNGLYPVSHCGCDDALYSCLKRLESDDDAQTIGEIYFDILQIKCFVKEHPKICVKWHWWGTCKEYKELKDEPPVVQVMNARTY